MTDAYAEQVQRQRDEARAEVERLRAHILDIDAHATPYGDLPDEPGYTGTYLLTAGALHRALGTIGHSAASCQAEAERDGAYRERAQLLAWLAAQHPAVLAPAPDVDEPGWQILYLVAGGQQLSWHIHPRDADLYGHVEQVTADDPRAQWDGHTTAEKYQRIAVLANSQSATTFSQISSCPDPIECGHEAALGQAEARIAAVGKEIADRVRAELVCCDVYGRVNDRPGVSDSGRTVLFKDERDRPGFHDICYWGEAAARLAEDRSDGSDEDPEAPDGAAETPTASELHARCAHPGWEYARTEGPRKQWDDVGTPPYDDNGDPDESWERNVDAGRDGWERFDYTEESYWRRPTRADGAS